MSPSRKLNLSEKRINISMPSDMADELQRAADKDCMKLSPFIRRVCQAYLKGRSQPAADRRVA